MCLEEGEGNKVKTFGTINFDHDEEVTTAKSSNRYRLKSAKKNFSEDLHQPNLATYEHTVEKDYDVSKSRRVAGDENVFTVPDAETNKIEEDPEMEDGEIEQDQVDYDENFFAAEENSPAKEEATPAKEEIKVEPEIPKIQLAEPETVKSGAMTTRSVFHKIEDLADVSEEMLDILNGFLMNPAEFEELIAEDSEYGVTAENIRDLKQIIKEYRRIRRKKVLCRSEVLYDIGVEINTAIAKKRAYDSAEMINKEIGAFTESLVLTEENLFSEDLEKGVVVCLAKNPELTRRMILEERFDEAAFICYPEHRGMKARTMLILNRKVNVGLDTEPLNVLPYFQDIERGHYAHMGRQAKLTFVLSNETTKEEIIDL